jgi:uncharacterized protein YjiS (DUF1127 family)
MATSPEVLAGAGRTSGALRKHLAALGQKLTAGARRLWGAWWDYQARSATVLILDALDERTLKDIGLSRSEIRAVVLGGDTARPRVYAPRWHRPAKL